MHHFGLKLLNPTHWAYSLKKSTRMNIKCRKGFIFISIWAAVFIRLNILKPAEVSQVFRCWCSCVVEKMQYFTSRVGQNVEFCLLSAGFSPFICCFSLLTYTVEHFTHWNCGHLVLSNRIEQGWNSGWDAWTSSHISAISKLLLCC